MIIGLTGKNAAGKGEVAKYLQERGFSYLSLSDMLRQELKKRRMSLTRDHLTRVGNELREKFGPGVLAERILRQITDNQNYVVDSFRNPGEVDAFRRRPDFVLWAVTASPQIRFERIKERARENDPETLAHFLAVEEREAHNADPTKQSLNACERLADHRIPNTRTIDQLRDKLASLLRSALKRIERPSWDRYFMNIAQVVASRSNCIKRKVAAIIVKDGRVISTGYNGTPRNTKNCFEGGCPRCNAMGPSGQNLSECFCSHGEENAIVQAAYHGIAIKGSTLFTTFSPCLLCTKMIINAGVTEVVFNEDYPLGEAARNLLKEAGVSLRKLEI
ncbi:MAG TPA: deaminase [Elusimicrobiota bacterium]|nr:deaminase [Elusimicrobiota bacterium]